MYLRQTRVFSFTSLLLQASLHIQPSLSTYTLRYHLSLIHAQLHYIRLVHILPPIVHAHLQASLCDRYHRRLNLKLVPQALVLSYQAAELRLESAHVRI